MKPDAQLSKQFFEKNGFFVIKNCFSKKQCNELKMAINENFSLPKKRLTQKDINRETFVEPDGVTKNKKIWNVIFNKRILKNVHALIGEKFCYTQHSDLHINLGAGKFHRDNAFRTFNYGPDWEENIEPYKVLRVAIYLSDYKESGSSLTIFPKTNKYESRLNKIEFSFWNLIRSKWLKYFDKNKLPHIFFSNKMVKLKNNAGDCILFDQRIVHAGGCITGKFPKYSIFLSYGALNSHTYNHHKYYKERPTYLKIIPKELKKKLKENSLLLEPNFFLNEKKKKT